MKSFLPNFHAVIFGAGGGIGAAMASRLSAFPSCIRLTLIGRNISKIEENVNAIGDTDIQMLQADICDEDSIASVAAKLGEHINCLLYTSPSPRDLWISRMPSSA